MPYTTLAYMAAMLRNDHSLSGWWILLFVLAVLADLKTDHHGARRGRRPKEPQLEEGE